MLEVLTAIRHGTSLKTKLNLKRRFIRLRNGSLNAVCRCPYDTDDKMTTSLSVEPAFLLSSLSGNQTKAFLMWIVSFWHKE